MAGWDYLVHPVPEGPEAIEELNLLGRQSWNLVAVEAGKMFFKRYANFDQLRANVAAEGQNTLSGWVADSAKGEKSIEAITSEDSGLKGSEHKHRVKTIVDNDMKVLRGITDEVDGHVHDVTILGTVEETDGHTHTFKVF